MISTVILYDPRGGYQKYTNKQGDIMKIATKIHLGVYVLLSSLNSAINSIPSGIPRQFFLICLLENVQ